MDKPLWLFASDLHLAPEHTDIHERFMAFMDDAQRHASRLYLLGDVFDQWLGDDHQSPYFNALKLDSPNMLTSMPSI